MSENTPSQDSNEDKMPRAVTEWVLFQFDNGMRVMGCVNVGTENSRRGTTEADYVLKEGNIVDIGNAHQVLINGDQAGNMQFSAIPLNYGDKRLFVRSGNIAYIQFLGNQSPLVTQVRAKSAGIEVPGSSTAPVQPQQPATQPL